MRHRGLVMGVALVLLSAAPVLAEDEPWVKFSTSVNYSVGDYGTDKDTTIVYVPFTLGVRPLDRFWLSLTVPFIYQDTQNVVLTGGGVASRKEQKSKFPTADENRGLGTGEFDDTLGVDVSKRLIDALFGYLTLSYTFIGDPPGADFRNSFGWSVGAAYAVLQPLSVFAFLEGSTAIARGQADPVDVVVGAEYKLTRTLKLTG